MLCIGSGPRSTFGNVAASTTNEPLPLAADMHHGKIAGAERRFLDGEAAAFVLVNQDEIASTIAF
jgi:hypothetical protein